MRRLVVRVVAASALLAAPLTLATEARAKSTHKGFTVVSAGLENPRGLAFGPDGKLYVAEGGLGGNRSTVGLGLCEQVPAPIGPYTGDMTARISKINPHSGMRTTIVDGLPSDRTARTSGALVSGVADIAFIGRRLYAVTSGAGCSHGLAGTVNAVLRVDAHNHTATQVADLSAFQMSHPVANPNPPDFEPDAWSVPAVSSTRWNRITVRSTP